MNTPRELPLFPLELVLLPYKSAPLHIFEERYKQMINGCLEGKEEFGIVWGADDNFRDTGCAAIVTDLITRFPDGRMNILIQGTRRFRVLERFDIHPYISAIVEDVEDVPEPPDTELNDRVQNLYREAIKLSLGWFRPRQESESDPGQLSFSVAGNLDLPLPRQQEILEMDSANRRLRAIADLLAKTLGELRTVKTRTGGNGHLA